MKILQKECVKPVEEKLAYVLTEENKIQSYGLHYGNKMQEWKKRARMRKR